MQGRRDTASNVESPIEKPRFPLPLDFGLEKEDTELSIEEVPLKDQRAYFSRKDSTLSGAPVYDFVITADDGESH